MTLQESVLEASAAKSPWQVRLAVLWRDEELPVPITEGARASATTFGVRLSTRPGSCVAHFFVNAREAEQAIARALAHWTEVVEATNLPRWEVVSFSIDQIDDDDVVLTSAA